jgi:hypothetical protein
LLCDHLGDEFWVVGEIGVHDDHIVSSDKLQAMYVCCSETKFACAGFEENVGVVCLCELVGYLLCSIWRAIVDDDEFPVEFSAVESLVYGPHEGLRCDWDLRLTAR